jgi:O-antigen biosynthesis protein
MSLLPRLRRTRLRWAVVVASPKGEGGERWGDTWFGRDLVAALERAGESARLVHRGGAESEARDKDDVVLVLRGLRRVRPRRSSSTTWLLWVISHPELVEADEIDEYDAAFAASTLPWRGATPLLQATDPHRFRPQQHDAGEPLLFIGSTRGQERPIVRDVIAAGFTPTIWGVGWEGIVDPALLRGAFLPNDQVPAAYASAGIVLNDHWADMAAQGFLSNRLFDAVASGAAVVSDEAVGLHEVLPSVRTYRTVDGLRALLSDPALLPDAAERADAAALVAREHSFDARAERLIKAARELRA